MADERRVLVGETTATVILEVSPHLLDSIPYKKVNIDLPKIPKAEPQPKGAVEVLGAGQPIPSHY